MRLRMSLVFGLLAVFVLGGGAAGWFASRAEAARPRAAVLGIEAKGNGDVRGLRRSTELAHVLTGALRARAEATGYEVVTSANKDLLEVKLLSDCLDETPTCMSAIGAKLGVDFLFYGHLAKEPARNTYTVSLFRLEVATRTIKPIALEQGAKATESAMHLFANSAFLGVRVEPAAPEPAKLTVITNVAASVTLNGIPRGMTAEGQPLVINDLPSGSARLVIEAAGFRRYEGQVELKMATRSELKVTMEPLPVPVIEPPKPVVHPPAPSPAPIVEQQVTPSRPGGTARILFWTSLVATGAGVAAFTITGLQVRSVENEQDRAIAEWGDGYKANGVQFPRDACAEARNDGYGKLVDICDRGERNATLTNVFIGVTAAAAVATALFYWQGYLSTSSSSTEHAAAPKSHGIVFTPELSPHGAGLGAAVQF